MIEAIVSGSGEPWQTPIGRRLLQVPLELPVGLGERAVVTFSGGVGQLVYDELREDVIARDGDSIDRVARFGDLGCELATRILHSQILRDRMGDLRPEGGGRATVYGLLRHSTELSGATIYLPHPKLLPLKNVPIVGSIGASSTDDELDRALELAAHGAGATCLHAQLEQDDLPALRTSGRAAGGAIVGLEARTGRVLVLLVPANVGKVFGNYLTAWGTMDVELIVIDEVPWRNAQWVRLGRMRENVVPLMLHAVR